MKRFWDKVHKTDSCWLWTAWKNNKGYGALMCKHPGGGHSNKLAHRVSWEMANGKPIPAGMCVLHACDTPACVNPEHLSIGTKKENSQDMVRKGRGKTPNISGENHHSAKLNWELVRQIRHFKFCELRKSREIAEALGVKKHSVDDVISYKSWRNAPWTYA